MAKVKLIISLSVYPRYYTGGYVCI